MRAAAFLGAMTALVGGCKDGPSAGSTDDATDGGDDGVAQTSGDTAADESGDETGGPTVAPLGVGLAGMRRLTRYEFDNVVRDILGDDSRPSQALLPEEERAPFDNEYARQLVTQPLVDSIEILARVVAQDLVADSERRAQVVGCMPSGPDDETCMRSFVTDFGRLAIRRDLDPSEVDEFVALAMEYSATTDDFYGGVEVVVRALLQDAEFVYRIEIGTQVPDETDVYELGANEVATRLAFFLWGSTPDVALLDAAADGALDTSDGVRDLAAEMLTDARAQAHVDRFHSLWLGYSQLPHAPELTNAMRTESAALIQRVVFDDASSWLDLFTSDETFLDDTLAAHYGLPAPDGGEGWVPYGDSGRMGLFSHGSFLSVASSATDTSPTKRGAFIRDQVMCMPVPPPPPDVMADAPPEGEAGDCKADRYAAHRQGTCASCHEQMDYIGFGLENYDRAGVFREHDDNAPECPISGEGEVTGIGEFVGPAGLAQLLVDNAVLENCVAQQVFRYAMGRSVDPDDSEYVQALGEGFATSEFRFDALLLELAGNDAFRFRKEAP